jgi:hypothetical protein
MAAVGRRTSRPRSRTLGFLYAADSKRREAISLREPNCRQPGKTQRRSQPVVDRDGPTNSRHRSDQQVRLCVLAAAG